MDEPKEFDDRAVPKARSTRSALAADAPAADLATPIEHARATGNAKRRAVDPRRTFMVTVSGRRVPSEILTWQHRAAETLHGWRDHEYHAGAPIQITRDAYERALKAVAEPDASGNYVPHAAALSPHAPHAKG